MKIKLSRISDTFHMRAVSEGGKTLDMDASPAIGGTDQGMRPMEVVLSALAGCSTIDVVELLRKQRQQLEDIQVTVNGERVQEQVPAVFTDIHLHFALKGSKLEEIRVHRALETSVKKLCSVGKMLEKTAKITYDYSIEITNA